MKEKLIFCSAILLHFLATVGVHTLIGFLLGLVVSIVAVLFTVPFDTILNLGNKLPIVVNWMMSFIVPSTTVGLFWGCFVFFYNKQ